MTSDLAPVLQDWIDKWRADRPPLNIETGHAWGNGHEGVPRAEYCFVSATQWLEQESGVSARKIRAITSMQYKTTSFRTAEALLMAIDREYMLANGQISVVANSQMSLETWMEEMAKRGCV